MKQGTRTLSVHLLSFPSSPPGPQEAEMTAPNWSSSDTRSALRPRGVLTTGLFPLQERTAMGTYVLFGTLR